MVARNSYSWVMKLILGLIRDYGSISLIGSVYKIIAKVLANPLKIVVDKIL